MRSITSKEGVHAMPRLVATVLVAGQLSLLTAVASAEPAYVGSRYANPEAETFGAVTSPRRPLAIAFIGPARDVGAVTGDPEKDTVSLRPVIIIHEQQPAFGAEGARQLQQAKTMLVAFDQPAFGAEGARELQCLVIVLYQPADGARAARELQSPEFPVLAALTNECRE
jgi:hypothetical protein